jgi:hypothetical protein
MGETPFVLNRAENPHPRMLRAALRYRASANAPGAQAPAIYRWWGYLDAMVDATGCEAAELEAWMDRAEAGR